MAEVCLHRTRADQVRPVYEALAELAPTPAAMAARGAEALDVMRSLGLRWRADNMITIARVLVETHGGRSPRPSSSCANFPEWVITWPTPSWHSVSVAARSSSTRTPRGSSAASAIERRRPGGSCGSTCTSWPVAMGPMLTSTMRCSISAHRSAAQDARSARSVPLSVIAQRTERPRSTDEVHSVPLSNSELSASPQNLTIIPSARRLMESLRDIGTSSPRLSRTLSMTASTLGAQVDVTVVFDRVDSWIRVADDGSGMSTSRMNEAMRYGTDREYAEGDLGKFGLGLKTASLSQCRRLTVATRSPDRRDLRSGDGTSTT